MVTGQNAFHYANAGLPPSALNQLGSYLTGRGGSSPSVQQQNPLLQQMGQIPSGEIPQPNLGGLGGGGGLSGVGSLGGISGLSGTGISGVGDIGGAGSPLGGALGSLGFNQGIGSFITGLGEVLGGMNSAAGLPVDALAALGGLSDASQGSGPLSGPASAITTALGIPASSDNAPAAMAAIAAQEGVGVSNTAGGAMGQGASGPSGGPAGSGTAESGSGGGGQNRAFGNWGGGGRTGK